MYDSSFKCTYHLIDEKIESDILYQIQFMQAFKMTDKWNETNINEGIIFIYNLLNTNNTGKLLLSKINSNEDPDKWLFLFSYDYFYLFHDLIIKLVNPNNDKNLENILLKNLLDKYFIEKKY
jgi:hypothetical protein